MKEFGFSGTGTLPVRFLRSLLSPTCSGRDLQNRTARIGWATALCTRGPAPNAGEEAWQRARINQVRHKSAAANLSNDTFRVNGIRANSSPPQWIPWNFFRIGEHAGDLFAEHFRERARQVGLQECIFGIRKTRGHHPLTD
jgi:hypothetical protein